ncbi:MAG: YciI family protein [Alphaproteobacteria bacterium]|nr:YciI family protein [Alphaproteobacteria bacterium]
MHYVIWAPDKADSKERRAAARPKHLEFWGNSPLKLVLAGPMIDEATGAMKGSMLLIEAESLEAVRAQAEIDPYWTEGVFERMEISAVRLPLGYLAEKLGSA